MPVYIVLLGPPGAGKGTQAKRLISELGIPQVSTGDLFRALKHEDTDFAREVQQIMKDGGLISDDVTVKMVKGRLLQSDAKQGAIMDGFPRTTPQADAFNVMLTDEFSSKVTVVPLMLISEEEAVRRISGRWNCPTCGTVYHTEFSPPQAEGICDKDRVALVQREDDKPEKARKRYQVYLKDTAPLIDYYQERGLIAKVDATKSIEDVTPELLAAIRSRMDA